MNCLLFKTPTRVLHLLIIFLRTLTFALLLTLDSLFNHQLPPNHQPNFSPASYSQINLLILNFLFHYLLIFSVLIYKVYMPTTFTTSSKASTQSPSLSFRLTAKALLQASHTHLISIPLRISRFHILNNSSDHLFLHSRKHVMCFTWSSHLIFEITSNRASFVVQWLRIFPTMQATRIHFLVWEDHTCCIHTTESPCAAITEAHVPKAHVQQHRSRHKEKLAHRREGSPCSPQLQNAREQWRLSTVKERLSNEKGFSIWFWQIKKTEA